MLVCGTSGLGCRNTFDKVTSWSRNVLMLNTVINGFSNRLVRVFVSKWNARSRGVSTIKSRQRFSMTPGGAIEDQDTQMSTMNGLNS